MAARSCQGWQTWGASSSAYGMKANVTKSAMQWKAKSNISCVATSEGNLDAQIGGWFAPVYQEPTWENEEKMVGLVRLQTGRKTSLCPHWKIDIGRYVRMWRARWSQESVLRRKAWRAKRHPHTSRKDRTTNTRIDEAVGSKLGRTTSKEMGKQFVPTTTSLLKNPAKKDGKLCGQKESERWQKTGKC